MSVFGMLRTGDVEQALTDLVFYGTSYSPTGLWLRFSIAAGDGGWTEVTGTGYAAINVTSGWVEQIVNEGTIGSERRVYHRAARETFTVGGTWTTPAVAGIWDRATGGNMLEKITFSAPLSAGSYCVENLDFAVPRFGYLYDYSDEIFDHITGAASFSPSPCKLAAWVSYTTSGGYRVPTGSPDTTIEINSGNSARGVSNSIITTNADLDITTAASNYGVWYLVDKDNRPLYLVESGTACTINATNSTPRWNSGATFRLF